MFTDQEVKNIASAAIASEGVSTMDESRPSANLIKTWADTQQQLLTNWFDTIRGLGGMPSLATWRQTVEAWQKSVNETLDVQAEWIRNWTETLATAQGTPEELRSLIRQGQEQTQRWIDAQRQIWQVWFDIVKDINVAVEPGTGVPTGKNLVQIWQDAVSKMMHMQSSLVQQWTTGNKTIS
jgi:hypothetical protein